MEQEETNEANDSTSQTNMPIENTNVDDSGNDDIDIESPQQTLKNDIYKQESL